MPAGARSFQFTKERVLGDTLESRERRAPEKEGDMLLFRDRLREIVMELPEDERTVVSLRFVEAVGVLMAVTAMVELRSEG